MSKFIWLLESVIHAIHDEQIAEHGGLAGTRDITLLQSALAKAKNLVAYGQPDIAELSASYCIGLAKNHPFNDGNKRTAFVAMELFLLLNGYELMADDGDCVITMLRVANGELVETELVAWIRSHIVAI